MHTRHIRLFCVAGVCVIVAAMTLLALELPDFSIGVAANAGYMSRSSATSTPTPSRTPSTQERIHAPRPMDAQTMIKLRTQNKDDHRRVFRVPSATPVPKSGATPAAGASASENLTSPPPSDGTCLHTVHSGRLHTDDFGRVCARPDHYGCCTENLLEACSGCDVSTDIGVAKDGGEGRHTTQCCDHYEHCVACCIVQMGTVRDAYLPCKETCRTSSESLERHGDRAYKNTHPHCFAVANMRMWGNGRNILSHYFDWAWGKTPMRQTSVLVEASPSNNDADINSGNYGNGNDGHTINAGNNDDGTRAAKLIKLRL